MPVFTYIAKKKNGDRIKDTLHARTRYEAMAKISAKDLTVISVDALGKDTPVAPKTEKRKRVTFSPPPRVKLSELSIFCRQLSICINSGITLIEALQAITEDMENSGFKKVMAEVNNDITQGASFSTAVAKHKKVFSPLFVALIRSAEESGGMHKVLKYLSLHLEKNVKLERKIQSITAYPIFITVFFTIVVLIATFFIVPRFEALFSEYGSMLPRITQIVFAVNRIFIDNFHLFVLAVIGAIAAVIMYGRTPTGRYHIDKIKLEIPLLGDILWKASTARFCRILAIALGGGVPIVKALDITTDTCNNKVLEKSLQNIKKEITSGSDIATGLTKHGNFPKLLARMVHVGENSGNLVDVLNNISDLYEDEVDAKITIAVALFEPTVIILFGGVVLVLILSIYVPVFKIATAMK